MMMTKKKKMMNGNVIIATELLQPRLVVESMKNLVKINVQQRQRQKQQQQQQQQQRQKQKDGSCYRCGRQGHLINILSV